MTVQEVDVEGFDFKYTITSEGDFYSWKSGQKVISKLNPSGERGYLYKTVNLIKDGRPVARKIHRLVAQAFIPNPENKLTVNHIDGDKLNNRVENLEWATLQENAWHAWETGLCDGLYMTQETKDSRTRELVYSKLSRYEYRKYKLTASSEILLLEGIPPELLKLKNPDTVPLKELWELIKNKCKDFMSSMSSKELQEKYKLTESGVSRIRNRNRYKIEWYCYDQWLAKGGLV